jgi:hypothetical protein
MHAASVEVLIEKSKFEPHVALGIAEAIDMAIQSAQLVTVPVQDARLSALESKMEAKFWALELKMEGRFGALESKMEARFGELESRMEARFGTLESKMEARIGGLETKIESVRADVVRWVFLVMLGNVAISAGVTAILNAVQG